MPKLHTNDIDIHYEVHGQGDPLLFIHGLGSSSRDWQYQVDFFSASHQVIVFDLRGHGKTSKPPGPYSITLFAEDTAALLRDLGIGPVHVVGISLGGMVALQLAVSHPELLKSLVIVNTLPRFVTSAVQRKMQLILRLLIVRLLGMRTLGRLLGLRLFPGEGREQLRREFARRWAGNNKRAYLESMRAIATWSGFTEHLPELQMPVLVVASEYDYTPVAANKVYAAQIPGAEFRVMPDAHHAVTVEYPDRFNAVLADFLARNKNVVKLSL